MPAIRIAAPAKLNLYLHVVGRRGDGYHLLDSLVAFASVGDVLHAAPADGLGLALDGPFGQALVTEPDNLVLRAARLLAAAGGVRCCAALTLTKRLPVASGIGGGSADAAAALKALQQLWRLRIPAPDLQRLALALGADVPMCLNGRTAFAGGVGEELAAAPLLPEAGLVLVNPGIAVATPAVFRARGACAGSAFSQPARFEEAPRNAAALAALLADRRNDLTEAACSLCPAIRTVLEALAAEPGCRLARMSGSGATCFGLFDDEAAARGAVENLARPGWWVAPGRLLNDTSSLAAAER